MAARSHAPAPHVAIRPTTPEDILACSVSIRAADRAECWAAAKWEPEEALWVGLAVSDPCLTALVDGSVVCIFGVVPVSILGGRGSPWLIGTDLLERHALIFLRQSRACIAQWSQEYALLSNYVDARNTAAMRYLRWLGFTLAPAAPFGPLGLPFHRFIMETPVCASL